MEGLIIKDSKKNYKDFTRTLFMNSRNGQISFTIPKKELKKFLGDSVVPKKMKLRLWKGD